MRAGDQLGALPFRSLAEVEDTALRLIMLRTWGLRMGAARLGMMFGGNTPTYLGAGQPTSEDDGELIGDGTPVYRTPPSKAAATPLSTTQSGPTTYLLLKNAHAIHMMGVTCS